MDAKNCWQHAARGGALTGVGIVFGYAYVITAGAALWTSLQLWVERGAERWFLALLAFNLGRWVVTGVVTAILAAVLAVLIGSATGIALNALFRRTNREHEPLTAVELGLALCLTWALAGLLALRFGLGLSVAALGPAAFLFWLIVPGLLYISAGGLGGWLLNRHLAKAVY